MTIDEIVSRWSDEYRRQAAPVIEKLNELLARGIPIQQAVNLALAETGFTGAIAEELRKAMGISAGSAFGATISTATAKSIGEKLSLLPWAADKLTLSGRLHGSEMAMRKNIIQTIDSQLKAGTNWVQMSRKLYDGYGFPETIQRAELPQYLKALVKAAQAANPNDPKAVQEVKRLARIATRNIDKLAQNDAPNRALKAAYRQLLDVAEKGKAKALGKALETAVNEKSRYYAERIARTEISRAWSEGFWAKQYDDPDVVGVRWRLSSRHPKVDICDFHANTNLYGMGPGIYPKGANPPHPAHPHCTCRLTQVYDGEVDPPDPDRMNSGGNEYLRSLDDEEQQDLLGVAGVKAWKQGDGWQGYLRSWQGHMDPRPRLKKEDFDV